MTGSGNPYARAVAITGVGMITSLGRGAAENWRRLTAGESGIRRIGRFPTEDLRTRIAGCVDFMDVEPVTIPALSRAMAEAVADEAVAASGIAADGAIDGDLFIAAPPIEHDWDSRFDLLDAVDPGSGPYARGDGVSGTEATLPWHNEFTNGSLADGLAARHGCTGSPITLTTACASGASAIQLGVESIRRGERTAALCVGTDGSINSESLIRFALLSALSTKNDPPEQAAKPFSRNRDGFVMAEGAAALVLEDPDRAKARGATILGYILGCGEAADTFHRTRSNPDGGAIIRSMAGAIADAGLEPADIDYINAHGTGTPENDKMEYLGISEVFGTGRDRLAVSSNKSMIGHTLTAAGAVEAVATVQALREGVLPPTINYREPDPNIELDVVPNEARVQKIEFALSNSFGFGGQNVSLVLAAAG
ncbi:MAG: beta-ketoacyl synthase N-terminal-like domain-containing protein [Rhodospirillaceae bacterium]|nr:beta-ketoacyl synthase N-terminal-like domain-containing protein [Rhodospirillaceae bacterium]